MSETSDQANASQPQGQPKPVITVIRHHHNAVELHDNAVEHLTECGFNVQQRYPFDGDRLLVPDSGVTPTIILGGGQNVSDARTQVYLIEELRWTEACLSENIPLLGICLGAQLIAHALGADVSERNPAECEYGFYTVYPTEEAGSWLPEPTVFMQAHYQEFALPAGAVRLAYSDRYSQQAFSYGKRAYGIQFHPEVTAPIHANWLADSWSEEMLATQGAQAKIIQAEHAKTALAAQRRWFEQALNSLFVEHLS